MLGGLGRRKQVDRKIYPGIGIYDVFANHYTRCDGFTPSGLISMIKNESSCAVTEIGTVKEGSEMAKTMAKAARKVVKTTRVVTAHVPIPLADEVDEMSVRLERSRGWIVKQALSAWLAQESERERLTREAMDDVDAGRTFEHQSVLAWAESLGTDQPLPVPR
ncbi:CopG family ribbon-helix-helix protein [Achromobacter aloeverae]